MMGYTDGTRTPTPRALRCSSTAQRRGAAPLDVGQPYPFFLAHQLDAPLEEFAARLAAPGDWIVEWKYDGIRAPARQARRRRSGSGRAARSWSPSASRRSSPPPRALPDGTVLDGEIVVWKDGGVAPFALLQQRIGRKTLTKKVLAEAPVGFIAYDLLELGGQRPARRAAARAARAARGGCSPGSRRSSSRRSRRAPSWPAFAALRARVARARRRGLHAQAPRRALRHRPQEAGRPRRGTWWKWKIDPLSVDCVLVYAQAGHGRRASVYTDYTFAVWNRAPRDAAEAEAARRGDRPAASRRSPDALQLVRLRQGLLGPHRRGVPARRRAHPRRPRSRSSARCAASSRRWCSSSASRASTAAPRHKSGIAVRFPRMLRIRARQAAARGRHAGRARGAARLAARRRRRLRRARPARSSEVARSAPTSMPFQLRRVTSLRPRSRSASLVVEVDEGLDRRRHRHLGGAGGVAVVDLDRDAEAALRERAQNTPSAPTLQKTRSPRRCHHAGVEALAAADHERMARDRLAQARAPRRRGRGAGRCRCRRARRRAPGGAAESRRSGSSSRRCRAPCCARSKPVAACSAAVTARITGCSRPT